jgi:hypothetical protein
MPALLRQHAARMLQRVTDIRTRPANSTSDLTHSDHSVPTSVRDGRSGCHTEDTIALRGGLDREG